MQATLWDGFKSWANRPFSSDMDVAHWFYFFGLILVLSAIWGLILRHVHAGVEKVA